MALTSGTRLGVYEISALIGVGGMGEVYRARDTQLNRDVAIKVLPADVADDGERRARFEREAQVLASLNHPNIAGIYGLAVGQGLRGLALELVEGPTLAEAIAAARLPLDEALSIARQIADALSAAHEKGIIHRDLKPANVKVRPDGTVKVLDFGLAKALDPLGPDGRIDPADSPTLSLAATRIGVILGTAAYMSPEQARGKPVDKRADIWAFGCVLYEMLAGRRPFDAEDVSMTLASVMMKEPDWTALPDDIPAHIRDVVRRCLAKDRKKRLADIAVAQFLIDEPPPAPIVIEAPAPLPVASPSPKRASLARVLTIAAASMLALGAAVGTTWWILRPVAPLPVRFAIVPPAAQPLSIQGFQRDIAITPDGRHIVYRTGQAGQTTSSQLVVRSLDQLDARLLAGISGIRSPFLSPDGRWIGFFEGNGGELKKVSILGGPPITLCRYTGQSGEASWKDGTIIFATGDTSTGLLSVPEGGGDPKVLTKPDAARGEEDHVHPFILPGGRAVLFTVRAQGQPIENAQIAVLDLQTGQKKSLIRGGSDARYVDPSTAATGSWPGGSGQAGYIVYTSAGTLRAVRFDPKRQEVTSDPVPVVEKVTMSGLTGTADYAISSNGTLVYVPGTVGAGAMRSLVWVNRQGREDPIKAQPRAYTIPRISPDGTRVALDIRDQENDVWIWDLTRETLTRLTFDPGLDIYPVWTPDSRRIIFGATRGAAQSNVFWQAADNTGTAERLTTGTNLQGPFSISPDGTRVLFFETAPKTNNDISMLTLSGPSNPSSASRPTQPLLNTTFQELNAEISPDGRWVAYQSNESGMNQVYVRPFPNVDAGRWQVSTAGGTRPAWARSGRELFYVVNNNRLMAVPVQTSGATFVPGNPTKLFDAPYYFGNTGRTYDVSADGQRFLLIKPDGSTEQTSTAPPASLVVVEHWTEDLKARMGSR